MNDKFRPTSAVMTNQRLMLRKPEPIDVAPGSADREFDALAEHFFSQDSLYPCEMYADDDSQLTPRRPKRALRVTLAALAISSVTLGSFLAYMHLIMPVPAEPGSDGGAFGPVHDDTLREEDPAKPEGSNTGRQQEPSPPASEAGKLPQNGAVSSAAPIVSATAPDAARRPIVAALDPSRAETAAEAPHEVTAVARPVGVARRVAQRGRAHDLVGRAFGRLNRGDAAAALGLARNAVASFPTRADAWIVLGSAYDALRDRASARDAFRSCVRRATGPFVAQCRVLARD